MYFFYNLKSLPTSNSIGLVFASVALVVVIVSWVYVDVSVPLLAIPGATAIVATLVLGPWFSKS